MKNWIVVLLVVAIFCLAGCGAQEETTISGMVASVDGTVISLMEMDGNMQGGFAGGIPGDFEGERPTAPEGMEIFTMPENFDPEQFGGTLPENFDPEQFEGTMPEGFDPENFGGPMPGGFGPGDGERPEGKDFADMGNLTTVDLANAHISIEIDGGKESGSMANITPGTFVTITLSGKGETTYVLISSMFGFGGFSGMNFFA